MRAPSTENQTLAAISTFFFTLGLSFASWAARIPDISHKLQLSPAALGTVLLALPVGSLTSLMPAGWLVSRFGSRPVTLYAQLVLAGLLPLLGLAPTPWLLAIVLFGFGFFNDFVNIGINTQVVQFESLRQRTVMSFCHGMFSVGTFAGAALGGLALWLQLSTGLHFVLITGLLLGLVAFFQGHLIGRDAPHRAPEAPLLAWPDGPLLLLGLIALCCMLAEGAMADWSSLYYQQWGGKIAAVGYGAFTFTMAAGRLIGDRLTRYFGSRKLLFLNGLGIGTGIGLAMAFPTPPLILIGFMLVGIGVATVVPLVYSAAGRSTTMSAGMALAAVSTVGYTGFLMGPPVIGYLAEAFTLRWAWGLVGGLGFVIVLLSRRVR